MERVRVGMLKASAAQAPPVAHNGIRPTIRPHRTAGWRRDGREPAESLPYACSASIARPAIAPRKYADVCTVTSRSTQGACCVSAGCKPPRCGAAAALAVCSLIAGGRFRLGARDIIEMSRAPPVGLMRLAQCRSEFHLTRPQQIPALVFIRVTRQHRIRCGAVTVHIGGDGVSAVRVCG